MPRPLHPTAWLSENAFISMVSAAVEAYPDETLGVIIGFSDLRWRRILAQYAVVYQTAERARDRVKADPKRASRIDSFLEKVTYLTVIGDFHSHPKETVGKRSSCWLSQDDKDSLSLGELGFVIAIDRDYKKREWKHLKRGSLLGCIFPYSLKITGWLKTKENEFKIARIYCPFALGLGR